MEKLLSISKLPVLKTIKDSRKFRAFLEDITAFFRQFEALYSRDQSKKKPALALALSETVLAEIGCLGTVEEKSSFAYLDSQFSDASEIPASECDDKQVWKSLMDSYRAFHSASPNRIKESLLCATVGHKITDLLALNQFIHEFEVARALLGQSASELPTSFLVQQAVSQLSGRLQRLVYEHFGSLGRPGTRFGNGSLAQLFLVAKEVQKGLDQAAILLGSTETDKSHVSSKRSAPVGICSDVDRWKGTKETKVCSHCSRVGHDESSCWDKHPQKAPRSFKVRPEAVTCSVHPHLRGDKSHSDAQCWVQHPELKPKLRSSGPVEEKSKPEVTARALVLKGKGDLTASVFIGDALFVAVVDSGAEVVVIPEVVFAKFPKSTYRLVDNIQVRLADNSIIVPVHTLVTDVVFEGVPLSNVVCVVLGSTSDLLIGNNVLKRLNMVMEAGRITHAEYSDPSAVCDSVTGYEVAKVFYVKEVVSSSGPKFGPELSEVQRQKLLDLWERTQNIEPSTSLPVIELPVKPGTEIVPVMRRPIPQSLKQRELLRAEVARLESRSRIEDTVSQWGSPMFYVPHPRKTFRAVIGYERVNEFLLNCGYPLPLVKTVLQSLGNATLFASLDGSDAYNQFTIAASRPLTAFVTEEVHKQFTCLSFGLKPAASLFQKHMCMVLAGLPVIVYIDDLLVVGSYFDELFTNLTLVLERLAASGYELNPDKCELGVKQVTFLGYRISNDGVTVSEQRVQSLREAVDFVPRTVREVQRLLGLLAYFRMFVPHFASLTAPLTDFIKTGVIEWTPELSLTIQQIVGYIKDNALVHPIREARKILETDASESGVGAVLKQSVPDSEIEFGIVGLFSHKFSPAEGNYATIEKEALAIVLAVTHWRQTLLCDDSPFVIRTDRRNLLFMAHSRNLRVQRWVSLLSEFSFTIEHVAA